jgi:hypothetical protein
MVLRSASSALQGEGRVKPGRHALGTTSTRTAGVAAPGTRGNMANPLSAASLTKDAAMEESLGRGNHSPLTGIVGFGPGIPPRLPAPAAREQASLGDVA